MIQKYKIIPLITFFLSLLFATNNLTAQDESATKGTEFWLTFLPNFHNSEMDAGLDKVDSLYIMVAAEEVTTGKIKYRNFLGQEFERNFTITNPEEVYTFTLLWEDFELQGFNSSNSLRANSQNEKIASQSFKITTDKGVNVYAHSQAVTTSEAATIYPVEALDTSYYVISYNSDGDVSFFGDVLSSSTPSQYAIVAPYDNTEIQIENSVPTWNNADRFQEVTLNAGDVYLVQADITDENPKSDLSGSKITSSNPVAVFSGHQRAKIPVNNGTSRDMLYEQIPSVKSLGREYIVTPFYQPSSIYSNMTDVYRVMAIEDDTYIEFSDGNSDITLDAGEFIEKRISNPVYINANEKIIVATYKKTSMRSTSQADSDPFMMILPPVEKFSNSYRFLNLQVEDPEVGGDVYTLQYISLITDNRNLTLGELVLDGDGISDIQFDPIPGTNYSYRNIEVGDGNHTIEGIYSFTVLVYGYGYANSYAYFAGMNYKGDQVNPKFQSLNNCYEASGTVTDSTYLDSGIDMLEIVDDASFNTNTEFDDFQSPADIVGFQTELENIYLDGQTTIRATDKSGLSSTNKIEIKGFTVAHSENIDFTDPDEYFETMDSLSPFQEYCFEIELYNYGKYEQTITDISITNDDKFYLNSSLPITIQPEETFMLEVCFTGGLEIIEETDVILSDNCDTRKVANLIAILPGDEYPPEISSIPDECYDEIDIAVYDSLLVDDGIEQINVLETINCEIRIRSESREKFELTAYITDKMQDAYYKIEAVDYSGNSTEYEEFIQGFTLDFLTSDITDSLELNIDYGEQVVGDVVCDTISITNYGSMPFEIGKPWFFEHIYFSTPESGFPITLESGETGQFPVCFRSIAVKDENYIDTLYFSHNCETVKIPLNAVSDTLFVNADGRCEVPVEMTVTEVPRDYFVMQNYPNPFQETSIITVGSPVSGSLQLDIYNVYGELIKSVADIKISPGIIEFEISKEDMPQGVYFYDVRINNFRKVRKMLIQ